MKTMQSQNSQSKSEYAKPQSQQVKALLIQRNRKKRKSKKEIPVVEQYVAQSDGATQYWRLSEPVQFPSGYKVEITFSKANDYFKIFDSNANRFDVTQFNGEVTLRNDTNIYVNGSLSNLTPLLNTEYVVKFDRTAENTDQSLKEISFIGARFNGVEVLSGYVKNFRVYNKLGVIIHEIPLTNKSQGATQLATVGNVNATMLNYTEAVWRKL